jgi:hypothetical protein
MFQNKHLVRLQASVFYNYIDQQINLFSFELDENGNYTPSISSNEYAYFNLDRYQNWGINSSIHYQLGGLTVRAGALVTGNYNIAHDEAGYGLMDLTLSKSFCNKAIQLSGGVKNILNTQTIAQSTSTTAHSGGSGDLPIAMGRIFFIRLIVNPFALNNKK